MTKIKYGNSEDLTPMQKRVRDNPIMKHMRKIAYIPQKIFDDYKEDVAAKEAAVEKRQRKLNKRKGELK